ncbi:DMT family transporter [Pantoea sp. 1.19]|uniref:DMT family transporter n=1 Tax=Pantoea sp. 1.19 TaxID=1925589 RepID=UPI000948D446|nr:DMT family transporter [Pantoea sp. 1.19]
MPFLFPVIAVLIWSVNAIVNKLAAGAIDPAAIAFYRWLLALLVLTPLALPGVWRARATVRRHLWQLLILGLLGMVLYQSLAYYAAHSVSALLMGILNSLIPLLTVLFSVLLLRHTPTLGVVLGGLLSLGGLLWLISEGQPARLLNYGIGRGELMMLAASASYALYGVLTRRWAIPLSGWKSLWVQILFGVLLLLPGFLRVPDAALTRESLPLVLFAGLFASLLAPWLWLKGVALLGANHTSIFMNLVPIFTAAIAVLFLHEQMHGYHYLGGGLTLVGVLLSQRLRRPFALRRRPQADPAEG